MKVLITTHDGKVYTDPSKIEVPRNVNTESFYRILENDIPSPKKNESTTFKICKRTDGD